MCWLAPCMASITISVWMYELITVSHSGQKCLLNALKCKWNYCLYLFFLSFTYTWTIFQMDTHLLALFVILLCCFTDFFLCVSSLILSLSSHQINRSSAGTCAARGHCRLLGHLLLLLHRPITAAVTELHYNLLGVFQVYKHVIWGMKVSTVLYLVWM